MHNKITKYLKQRHSIAVIVILCLIAIYTSAQSYMSPNALSSAYMFLPDSPANSIKQISDTSKKGKEPMLIVVKWADLIEQRKDFTPQILSGNVVFFHNGAYLYCDSAYYIESSNVFEAFSNVRMEQGDTLFLYGDYMHYDGATQLIKVRENVKLENVNDSATLFTDSLNYDRLHNIGYYFAGGILIDPKNELSSFWGQYEPNFHKAVFTDSVKLVNSQFKLYSDTLLYDTNTRIATIVSPTRIVSDSGTIYTSKGWYNTLTDESLLLDQSQIVNIKGNRILRGDSIIYHRAQGYGEVFGNMFLQDTLRKMILQGHYGRYDERTEYAMATDSASFIEYSQKDSLYLHADTLEMIPDSIYKELRAYYGVRFYRRDLQGVCDSMQFNSRDSILHLYKDPVLWNETNQMYGDTIDIFMNDSTIDYIHVKRYSFSIQNVDSTHFNQLKGRSMKIYMQNNTARRILVEGNAESIFYPTEDNGNMIGLNKLESSFLEIMMSEGKLERIKTWSKSIGKLTPMFMLTPNMLRLDGFYWFNYLRPLNKDDIFRDVKKKQSDSRPKALDIFTNPEFQTEQ